MFTINLYEMFGTDTLRYRDSAKKVVQSLPKGDSPVIIDFAKIVFASNSFSKELLYSLRNRKATFENRSQQVENMMGTIERKPMLVAT